MRLPLRSALVVLLSIPLLLLGQESQPPAKHGPFGFERGMTVEQIVKLVGQDSIKKREDDRVILTTAPSPHPDFELYIVTVSPDAGLLKLSAVSKDITTSAYGDGVRSKFSEIQEAVSNTYGKGKSYDFLRAKSIWNEPNEWMMGLLKEERTLAAIWEFEKSDKLITAILLEAVASGTEKGYLRLGYEFDGFSKYMEEKKKKKSVF